MHEQTDLEVYEPPALVEIGKFAESTLGGINSTNVDSVHRWFHG